MNQKISIIVATGRNREIGAGNKLLWKIPEELRRFREITTGHPIIMGRKTFESIGRILPNRTNIIITRDHSYKVEGGIVVHSLGEALSQAQNVVDNPPLPNPLLKGEGIPDDELVPSPSREKVRMRGVSREIFIIGGAQIFEQALPLADKLYVTLVDAEFSEADSFFPEYEDKFTKKVFEQDQESAGYKYRFLEFEK